MFDTGYSKSMTELRELMTNCKEQTEKLPRHLDKEAETDPNTTPIGDDDYYFHRPGAREYEAVYYNPDATAGGQFVVLHLPYELISEAKEHSNNVEKFYEYLDSGAFTELIDLGTQEFEEYLGAYAEPSPDFIGRTEKTMQALITQAECTYQQLL